MGLWLAWKRDERGAVALMFGLVFLVLMTAVGAAFDYSRAASSRADLQRALDGAALLVAKNRDANGDYTVSNQIATDYVRSTFGADRLTDLVVNVTFLDSAVKVDGSALVPTTVSNVAGIKTIPIAGSAQVSIGSKIEVVLVLDNTGSMAQLGKLDTLKAAAHNFLHTIQGAVRPDLVRVGLVPFDTDVNVGSSYTSANWLDPATLSGWAGGSTGCVTDRDQPNDVQDTAPSPNSSPTLFKADGTRTSCALAPILPLTGDFTSINAAIDGMNPSGNTNTTIGLVWGLHLLTSTEPITNAAALGTKGVLKYVIFMTDGQNTQNRWTNSSDPASTIQSKVDDRTRAVCDVIRQTGIQLFTARIIEGNAPLLQQCATTPDMYFDVQNVGQLDPVFQKIAKQITGLRIAR